MSDFVRLCEAALDGFNRYSGMDRNMTNGEVEAIVHAVLTALREPSDAVKKAAEEGTEFYGAGEYISYDAGETIARAVDFILAEPAKA